MTKETKCPEIFSAKANSILTKGKYVVIDPCYVIKDWDTFCDRLFKHTDQNQIFCLAWKDNYGLAFSTASGDGCYPVYRGDNPNSSNEVGECGVDCGMLAIIPIELVADHSLGVVIELTKDSTLYELEGDKNLSIGDYSIHTSLAEENHGYWDGEDDE